MRPQRNERKAKRILMAISLVIALNIMSISMEDSKFHARAGVERRGFLIITRQMFVDSLVEYIKWKNSMGFEVYVVTAEWIQEHVDGEDIRIKIRNCIRQYYNDFGVKYAMLIGDSEDIEVSPYEPQPPPELSEDWNLPAGYYWWDCWPAAQYTSIYYSDLSDKVHYNETEFLYAGDYGIYVGIVPVRTPSELQNILYKTINYHASPCFTFVISEDMYSAATQDGMDAIRALASSDVSMDVYVFGTDSSSAEIHEKLFERQGIIMESGHGYYDFFKIGDTPIMNEDASNFQFINPLFIASSCGIQAYHIAGPVHQECLDEAFLKAQEGPAVIIDGAPWGHKIPGETLSQQERGFWEDLFGGKTIGQALIDHCEGAWQNPIHLFGDPSLVIVGYAQAEWPMFHHDLTHTGYSISTAPETENIMWSSQNKKHFWSSPALAKGKLYVGSYDHQVCCFDAYTGGRIWNYPTENSILYSSPAVAEGRVYIGSHDDNIYCLNASTGDMIWNYITGGNVDSSPAVVDGKVYVGSDDNKVYCLDAYTGDLLWSYSTGGSVFSSPAIADGNVYVGSQDNKIYCLDANTGAHVWNYTTGACVDSSPAVRYDKIYVGSCDGKVYCLDATTGAHIWEYTTTAVERVYSSPAIWDWKVYIGSHSNYVYCLDAYTGDLIWNYSTGRWIFSSPAVSNEKVYVGNYLGLVLCLDAYNGNLIWNYTAGGSIMSSPAIAYGRVYIGPMDSEVHCFGDPPSISDFPTLFASNNVRMIYPSDSPDKPLGCDAAWVSDWLASALIYARLETVTEGLDINPYFVGQATGKAIGDHGTAIISFGGQFVNPVVKYAESDSTPDADRAPVKFHLDDGTFRFQYMNGTNIIGAELPQSVINVDEDMFLIEVFRDGDGRYLMLCYGFGWKGTYAAGKYFDREFFPNLEAYPYSWIIVHWDDTNGDSFVNAPGDGDTYTIIATG